jgi:transposase
VIRSLLRHRDSLVQMAAAHVQHMQKALTQMNLQIHHVLSDITGQSGLAILDAIVKGERNPLVLAQLRDQRVKASEEVIVKSLVGDYRREHLFTLGQSLEAFRYYQGLMAGCDEEIEEQLQNFDRHLPSDTPSLPPEAHAHRPRKNEFRFDMRSELYCIFGVDVTAVPGIHALTGYTLLAEVGTDWSKFRSGDAFASWTCLCPHNKKSGGKILSAKTRKNANRVNRALRLAAQALQRDTSYLSSRACGPRNLMKTRVSHYVFSTVYPTFSTLYLTSLSAYHTSKNENEPPAFTHPKSCTIRWPCCFGFRLHIT